MAESTTDSLIFSSEFSAGIVRNLKRPGMALRDYFFGESDGPESRRAETIRIDYEHAIQRPAVYSDPEADATLVPEQGYTSKEIRPGHISEYTPVSNDRVFQRAMGEGIGAMEYSPTERRAMCIAKAAEQLITRVGIRQEVECANILVDGEYTIASARHGDTVIDVERPADNVITLAAADQWDADTSSPFDTFRRGSARIVKNGGEDMLVDTVLMNEVTYSLFFRNAEVRELLDTRFLDGIMIQLRQNGRGMWDGGMYSNYRILVHRDYYLNDDGDLTAFIPDNVAIMVSTKGMRGTISYGVVKNAHFPDGIPGDMDYALRTYLPSQSKKVMVECNTAFVAYAKRGAGMCRINVA